ncbi:MAG: hypothetical protein KBD90_05520 [Alphaproteobacteria bacterium]|nr:hypothetical protein [Alphaproteobacteria bacterium]
MKNLKIAILLLLPFVFCLTACGLKKPPKPTEGSDATSREFFKTESVDTEAELEWVESDTKIE